MSTLDPATLAVMQMVSPNGAVGDDPMIRHVGDELFVVNRADGNNVTILDAATFAVKEQLATGAGSNPQDVAVVGEKLYVPSFGTAGVVVLTRGSQTPGMIDLSALDTDGKPDCHTAYAVDTKVYVSCELLDAQFKPRGPGLVAVIDSVTDTVATMVTLTNKNPFGVFEQLPAELGGDLVIPTVPSFQNTNMGCIEKITTGATPAAGGCLVQNSAIGGFGSRLVYQKAGDLNLLFVVVSNFPNGNLQGFDLDSKMLWPAPLTPDTQVIVDATACPNGEVVVAESNFSGPNGLRVYVGTTEKTTMPLAVGLNPASAHGLVCY
jgi:hypothetical protein